MRKYNILILITVVIIFISCKCDDLFEDMQFKIVKRDFNNGSLKTEGYYFNKYGNPERLTIYFLYKNGILLHAGDGYTFDIEEKFVSGDLYKKLRENKYCWGLFQIDSTSIKFERYYNTDNPSKESYIRSGTILNDTTFIITKVIRSDGKDESDENETYHFKQFSPKPDSTNIWIK